MAYLDYISAKQEQKQSPAQVVAELRNEQLEAIMHTLYTMPEYVDMMQNSKVCGYLNAAQLRTVCLELYKRTDNFIELDAVCYIVATSFDDSRDPRSIDEEHTCLVRFAPTIKVVFEELLSPTFVAPRKSFVQHQQV